MRPVNLIPKEERLGSHRPMRSGPTAYIIVGALLLALLGVTALVSTGNQITDRKSEIAALKGEVASAQAKTQSLSAYTQFHTLSEQRIATITSLADSRFDWARVMQELSLILPGDVWLTGLSASATPTTETGGAGGSLRAAVAGPALSISGCARTQDAVAGFADALKGIDGVTRVGFEQSAVGSSGATSGATDSASGAGCPATSLVAQFAMVVAFDAAPAPASTTSESAAAAPSEATEATASTSSEEG
jgi:Tfp pilus assembly protein PilN